MDERAITVTVVIPAWNAEAWIERALDSVLGQTRPPDELIVVNDGSTDGTESLVRTYGDPVRLLSQENRGLSAARNVGIEVARGRWVAFLDADDYWLPEKLEKQLELIEREPRLGFVSAAARLEYEDGTDAGCWSCVDEAEQGYVLETLFRNNAAVAGSGSAVIARRDLLLELGGFDTCLKSLEDIDMWMRLAAVASYACVREPMVVIARRRGSMSRNLEQMKHNACCVMRKNRHLLGRHSGRYWRWCYAGMLTDYAKWEIRTGRRRQALGTLLKAAAYSPVGRGRLIASLLFAAALAPGRL